MHRYTQQILFAIVMLLIDLLVLLPLFIFRVNGIAGYGGWGYPGPGVMFVNVLLIWLLYIGIFNVFLADYGGNIGKSVAKAIFDKFL
ncbi:MAG TPA: hypothetical protein HA321_01705 [Halobacteriales archaeon]|jgi:hypothetical protein|nr:hypothetical protein [Halobacteriales archaeon]